MRFKKYFCLALPTLLLIAFSIELFAETSASKSAEAANTGFSRGLLWKIEKPGKQASFIFGTIHIADTRVNPLPDVVNKVFAQAKSFTMEIKPSPENTQAVMGATVIRDGKNLDTLVTPRAFSKLQKLMEGYGVPGELVKMLKPWAAMMVLVVPRQNPEQVMDNLLYRAALEQHKTVYEIETPEEQMDVFDSMPMDAQVALLENTVEYYDDVPKYTKRLIDFYVQRDLKEMWKLSNTPFGSDEKVDRYTDMFVARVLYDRNVLMADRLEARLSEGGAFIAIGSLHLYGDKGMLGLLQKRGYRISVLY